mmetsp:Transcript_9652/g.24680  ORF Transcript_9652/g.24680 Transcript_9652/m.24680 type:complete len:102 (-) Transcript_9652:314-619(-)
MRLGQNQSIQSAADSHTMPAKFAARDESGVDWVKIAGWVPFAACAVGILSALLGLGGGELMGPLLLGIGMEAQRRYGVRVEVKVRLRFRIGPGRERIIALL